MQRRRLHLVACWLAAVAILMNATASLAGVVRCQGPNGEVAVEAGCEHDHCEPAVPISCSTSDGHAATALCSCADCACEDTPVGAEVWIGAKRDLQFSDPAVATIGLTVWTKQRLGNVVENHEVDAHDPPPPCVFMLCALRTVVLLI